MCASHNDELTRRDFLRTTTCGMMAAGMGPIAQAAINTTQPAWPKPILPAGVLGKTKFPATLVSYGGIMTSGKTGTRVLKAAIDSGVNLVHISSSYQNGNSIQAFGDLFKAEKRYRDKVFLCYKSFEPGSNDEIDKGLQLLGTDHLDVALTTMDKPDKDRIEAIQAQQDKLKKQGKVRHTGFVCHGDMTGVMELVLDKAPDYFDMTLLAMRAVFSAEGEVDEAVSAKGQQFLDNLKAMRKKGVGILSMKSGTKGLIRSKPELFEAHVKAVLKAGADSVLTSIDSFQQVDLIKGLKLKSPHITPEEEKSVADFENNRPDGCLMCADCRKACPLGVPVNDLMRIRMYHREYGLPDHARNEFAMLGLDARKLAAACTDCSTCSKVCPINLAGPEAVKQIASMFA